MAPAKRASAFLLKNHSVYLAFYKSSCVVYRAAVSPEQGGGVFQTAATSLETFLPRLDVFPLTFWSKYFARG